MKKYRPVAAVAVRRGGRWLLVRKPRENHAWQFPQGGAEVGEKLIDAAVRELREECGEKLQVKIFPEPVAEYRYDFPVGFVRACDGKSPRHEGAEVTFFVAEWKSGEPEPDGVELVETRWRTPEEIRGLVDSEYWKIIAQFL